MSATDTKGDAYISRRKVLGGVLALGATAAAGMVSAQQVMQNFVPPGMVPKPKGVRV